MRRVWQSIHVGQKSSKDSRLNNRQLEILLQHFGFRILKYDLFQELEKMLLGSNSTPEITNLLFSMREWVVCCQKNDSLSCKEKIKQQEEEMF
jgi:hypothetical protein